MDLLSRLIKSALSTVTEDPTATENLLNEYWLAYPEAKSAAVVRWMYKQVTYTAIAPDDSEESQIASRPTADSLWIDCRVVSR